MTGLAFLGGLIHTVLGIVAAYITAAILGTGFGELRTAIVKMAGILIFSGALASLIPYGGILVLFVYLGLLVWQFELEMYEAVVFALVLFAVRVAVALAIVGMTG